jgi:hypothetical protein
MVGNEKVEVYMVQDRHLDLQQVWEEIGCDWGAAGVDDPRCDCGWLKAYGAEASAKPVLSLANCADLHKFHGAIGDNGDICCL